MRQEAVEERDKAGTPVNNLTLEVAQYYDYDYAQMNMKHIWEMEVLRWLNLIGEQRVTHRGRKRWKREREKAGSGRGRRIQHCIVLHYVVLHCVAHWMEEDAALQQPHLAITPGCCSCCPTKLVSEYSKPDVYYWLSEIFLTQ